MSTGVYLFCAICGEGADGELVAWRDEAMQELLGELGCCRVCCHPPPPLLAGSPERRLGPVTAMAFREFLFEPIVLLEFLERRS